MRPERNPLDLNNFPEDFSSRDGKQALEDTSSSAAGGGYNRKKKSGRKESKDESEKVYECRFCSLRFCKSQALGGHMNRHRQERETETLNRARQLVFSNDNLIPQPGGQPMVHGGYHLHQAGSMNDPTIPFRSSVYPPRFSTAILPPPSQSYMYPSPSRILSYSAPQPPVNEYFVGHALPTNNNHPNCTTPEGTNYTCIGAPVGQGFVHNNGNVRGGGGGPPDMVVSGGGGGRDMSLQNQQHMDLSPINRYQDGF